MIARLGRHAFLRTRPGRYREGLHSVHLADVRFEDGTFPAFVKLFQPGSGGLCNEAIGWALARACGVPVAARAAILDLEIRRLGSHAPPWALRHPEATVQAWAVQQIEGSPLAFLQSAAGDTDHWDDVASNLTGQCISALDEWTSNNDRHGGNLIRDSRGRWWAIDFSEMLGSNLWPYTADLGIVDHNPTDLLRHARTRLREAALRRFVSNMVCSADRHEQAFAALRQPIADLLAQAHGPRAAQAVVDFLGQRAARHWMPDRLKVI